MRAVYIDAAERIRVEEVAVPEPGSGQVRIKVDHVGICGSDLHYYFEGANGAFVVREPLIPGHEMSGRVDFDPAGKWAPGTPVTIHPARFGKSDEKYADRPHLWKGGSYFGSASTWPHTQGAMADYILVEDRMVRPLPDGLPIKRAALSEPLGVAIHAINQAEGVEGQRVLVTGAGPIGLCVAAASIARGAESVAVSDVTPGARDRAQQLGVDRVLDARTEPPEDGAFDVVFECSANPVAISGAFRAVRPAGTVIQVGMVPDANISINLAPFVSKEVTYRSTFRFKDEVTDAVAMLEENPQIESVITHDFTVDEVVEAFNVARDSDASGKVLVSF